jgi:hypothetical protein
MEVEFWMSVLVLAIIWGIGIRFGLKGINPAYDSA